MPSYDFRPKAASEVIARYNTTAGVLARILFKCKTSDLLPDIPYDPNGNGRTYPGTNFLIRKVPENSRVTLIIRRAGGRVEDQEGGWIADRFGPALSRTQAKHAAAELEREGVAPE